jgi:hypothetical protein
MKRAAFLAGMTVALLAVFGPQPSKALVASAGSSADVAALETDLQALAQQKFKGGGGGGGKGNANRNGGGGNKNANRNNNNNRQNNKNFNNNNNRNKNVNVRVNVRPVRGWVRRPYYGTVVGGVALGAIIAASTIPVAPAPGLCWYWTDATQSNGYWDYCS